MHVIDSVLTPKAADTKAAVATEAGAKKAPTSTTGRRLLNRGGGGRGLGGNAGRADGVNSYAPTISLDSSEQAIWAAVNGASTDPAAVQRAAAGNQANAKVLVHFKEDATYATGINDGLRGSGAALGGAGN